MAESQDMSDTPQTSTVAVEIIVTGLAQASGYVEIKFSNGAYVNVGLVNGQILGQGATPDQLGGVSTFSVGPNGSAVSVTMSLAGAQAPGNGLSFSGKAYFPAGVSATANVGGQGPRAPIPSGQFDITLQCA